MFNFLAYFGHLHIPDDINFEGSPFISELGSILNESFCFFKSQELVNLFVPAQYKKKYPLDSLYF